MSTPFPSRTVDYCVAGAGIVGLAVARELLMTQPGCSLVVLNKEAVIAAHQTGHNSGVVHAGLYYKPGSVKSVLCSRGVGLPREFCQEHGLTYDECGKLVVDRRGVLVDDFVFARHGRVLSVRNAPSPAATASLAIAERVVREVRGT